MASLAWDPLLLSSQILTLQTLHYLTLSFITPALLSLVCEPTALSYEGGASNVAMVMDWREMAGVPTFTSRETSYDKLREWVWSGGRRIAVSGTIAGTEGMDYRRGWVLAFCWIITSAVDTFGLYKLISHPRLILDFTLTLYGIHIILTTYYAASFPTSLFYWLVVGASCVGTLVIAEQLCVKREMRVGLEVNNGDGDDEDELEMGRLLSNQEQ